MTGKTGKYRGYDKFAHYGLARLDPDARNLTADQFDLWWRLLSDEERSSYNAMFLLDNPNVYLAFCRTGEVPTLD